MYIKMTILLEMLLNNQNDDDDNDYRYEKVQKIPLGLPLSSATLLRNCGIWALVQTNYHPVDI